MPKLYQISKNIFILFPRGSSWLNANINILRAQKPTLVDCGSTFNINIKYLKKILKSIGIHTIEKVIITHSHIDHYRNIGMFPTAKTLEYWGIWYEDKVVDWKEQFTDDIRIIKTPGHNYDGITLLVKTEKGIIAICGDVFWKENFPDDDPYASDKEKLKESRKKILKLADYIIPGHGKMFKVEK